MEKGPRTIGEMSLQELKARLVAVNDEIFRLTSGLDRIPAPFQESTQGDDDAVESESVQQAVGGTQERVANLRREMMEIETRLSHLKSA